MCGPSLGIDRYIVLLLGCLFFVISKAHCFRITVLQYCHIIVNIQATLLVFRSP